MKGALYVSDSQNEKISGKSKVDATYVSIKKTCSDTCPFRKDSSCYAMNSFVAITVKRMDRRARNYSPLQLARSEAKAIDEAYKGKSFPKDRDLRLHVSGDSRTLAGTRLINNAIKRWKKRGGRAAWTYTHSWNHVPREEWSNVSVLASIESTSQVAEVRRQGYAPAIVVPHHPSNKTFVLDGSDTKFIPCPAQTKAGVSCSSCRLCFNADRLFNSNMGIAFAAHGVKQNQIKRRLTIIQ
jgi:hypothetical protein